MCVCVCEGCVCVCVCVCEGCVCVWVWVCVCVCEGCVCVCVWCVVCGVCVCVCVCVRGVCEGGGGRHVDLGGGEGNVLCPKPLAKATHKQNSIFVSL